MEKVEPLGFASAQIGVRDMDRAVQFYEMLGLEVYFDETFPAGVDIWKGLGLPESQQCRGVFMRVPDKPVPFLDLIQFINPPTEGEPYPTQRNVGICRISFTVTNLEETVEFLRSKGVEFAGPIARYEIAPGDTGGVDATFVCCYDPDGTVIEYMQLDGDVGG